MGSECNCSPQTPHYDIKMSKRTRKPLNLKGEANQWATTSCSFKGKGTQNDAQEEEENEEDKRSKRIDEEQENDHKRSLKQLIEGRSSLGKHFTQEEKQLQVVVKQHEDTLDGMKLGKMARFLGRLIKIKRKKKVLQLTM